MKTSKYNIKPWAVKHLKSVVEPYIEILSSGYHKVNMGQNYRNDPKFSDRYAWANSADPDQTAPRGAVWSGSTLFAIPSASFGLISLW